MLKLSAHADLENPRVNSRTIHVMFALNWFTGARAGNFPIGSYVKTMSADGGHLEFPITTKI